MAVTPSYVAYIVDQLSGLGEITAKRMFGGIGLYYDAKFFGLIDEDVTYLRVDDSSRPEFVARGMPPFQPVRSKPELISKNYFQVPADVLEDAEAFAAWAKRALAAVVAKPAKAQSPRGRKVPKRKRVRTQYKRRS